MEAIGYAVTNNFMLIAVDTRLQVKTGDITLSLPNTRKVYKIGRSMLISVIGVPHKISDVYKYILNLKYSENSYESVVSDLESIFKSGANDLVNTFEQLKSLIDKFTGDGGTEDLSRIQNEAANYPELNSLLTEIINAQNSNNKGLTCIFLFDREFDKNVHGMYVLVGNNLAGVKNDNLPKDNIYYNLVSSITGEEITKPITESQREELKPYLQTGWEQNEQMEQELLEKCKSLLTTAFSKISSLEGNPNVVFYLLNKSTDFEFKEPEIKLTDITFNRS
jgi:hypothetical protein